MKWIPACALILSMLPGASAAENWPGWRGPTADGLAGKTADPPTAWDEKTNVKWKVELPGRGSATPVVWGERIFVLSAAKTDREAKPEELPKPDPKFQALTTAPRHFFKFDVTAYDRETGKQIWTVTAAEAVPHEGHHETHSYAGGSPATDGKRLYVCFGSFGVFAFDLDGKLLWKRDLGRLNTRLGWGEVVTPVIAGETLVLNRDQEAGSKLIALNAATGKTKWEVDRDEKSSWNTPLIVEHNKRAQVIVNGTGRARSYDLTDGKVIWEVGGMTVNAIPSPIVSDGIAYIMSGYRSSAAVAVPLDSTGDLKETGKVAWRYGKGTPYVPSPLLLDRRLFFTQKNTATLTILDAKSGKPILEAERIPKLGSLYASPMAAAGRIYLADRGGTTVVLKAGDKAEVLATNKLNDSFDASPVAVGKTLFLRGDKFLYALEQKPTE